MIQLTLVLSGLALLSLLALHFVSPEYKTSWRMISEYALGKYKWLITSFFIFWGLSSITLGIALWPLADNTWAAIGVVVLFISAVGEIMGGLFDIKHKLHGASFMLGVPAVPIAAMFIGYNLSGANSLVFIASQATWISLVLMGVAMMVMMSGFKKSGIPMGPDATPPEKVPDGVIALAGYANRLLVICYVGWLMVVATFLLNQ
jgi:Protein of unknown function (DUF998)